ncbi:LytR/AlgR family response regulator transcription factor [Euzebya sp.]|uniref:LytR/AlgR family response regulator transcription factor n=1 Tax=Euzebya sp. TaxID=1971409 RepID=UPI003516ED23
MPEPHTPTDVTPLRRDGPARCLIVDDEAPAREELRFLLNGLEDRVTVLGEATNAAEALGLLGSIPYDLVLLDIHLPGGSGLDVARQIRAQDPGPAVIFTTAYADHAVDAFELQATDYLMKPIDRDRLITAIDRALADRRGADADVEDRPAEERTPGVVTSARIPVQQGDRTVLVNAGDVVYATATRGYSYLKLPTDRYLVSWSLTDLEERLGPSFFRAHRSHLVNLAHVAEMVGDYKGSVVLVMDDPERSRVEVSRRQVGPLRRALGMT